MTLNALITGGAKGIGLAIARRLAADGASLALIGRDGAALRRAASELGARHAIADVTNHPCCGTPSLHSVAATSW